MAEPQRERFLSRLADPAFAESWSQYSDLAEELLFYFDPARSKEIATDIRRQNKDRQDIIIRNIARLYPLSASLLDALLYEIRYSDEKFADCFQNCSIILKEFDQTLKEVKKRHTITHTYDELERKVANLRAEIQQQAPQREKFEKLQKEKARLEMIKTEGDLGKKEKILQEEIKRLHYDLGEQEKIIHDHEENIKKMKKKRKEYEERTKELLDELESMDNFASEEQKNLLKQLYENLKYTTDALENL